MNLSTEIEYTAKKARDLEERTGRIELCASFVIDKFRNPDKYTRSLDQQIDQLEEAMKK